MSKIDKLRKQNNASIQNAKSTMGELHAMSVEANRVADVAKDVHIIVSDLDMQFEKATGLKKKDITFLFLALALQVIRQYILTKFPERLGDHTAAEQTFLYHETHSDRVHRYYNPSLEEIWTNPVPFDANVGASGALAGGGKLGHRVKTLGHDPILGLIFGTANIATATLTTNKFQSYHIGTNLRKVDYFKAKASTPLVLMKTKDKLLNEEIEGKEKIGLSLLLELDHLASDIGTKNSLPLPIVTVINPQIASNLAKYGMDMANIVTVGKQATYAVMINSLIAMLHSLYCDTGQTENRRLYSVRTRKILMHSNTIASASNVVATGVLAAIGDQKTAIENFDLGGFLVAIYRITKDKNYMKKIKQEFLAEEFYDLVMGEII